MEMQQIRPVARYLNILPRAFQKMFVDGCPKPELMGQTYLLVNKDQSVGGGVILGPDNELLEPTPETWPQLEWAAFVFLAGDLYFRLTGEDASVPLAWKKNTREH